MKHFFRFFCTGLIFVGVISCGKQESFNFDISVGEATKTLKMFARQADAELLVSEDELIGIYTKPIKGEYTPAVALKKMTFETGLIFSIDSKTNAIAVTLSK